MLPLYGEGRGPFLEEKVENEGVDVWERENVMAFEMRSQVHYAQICIVPSAAWTPTLQPRKSVELTHLSERY